MISTSTNEMMCEATISNGDISLPRVVVVDGGFSDDLILELKDINELQLGSPVRRASFKLADNSFVEYDFYAPVTLTLTLTDGSSVSCELNPQVLIRPSDEVAVVESAERLVGYQGMYKLDLKQDFRNHRLVRRTHRV